MVLNLGAIEASEYLSGAVLLVIRIAGICQPLGVGSATQRAITWTAEPLRKNCFRVADVFEI